MTIMPHRLSFDLHALTARLDRAADRIIREREGLSYARFMILFWICEVGPSTQRDIAGRLGVTEPSVSRMISVLADHRLVRREPAKGNRHSLALTPEGRAIVRRSRAHLEAELEKLVASSGVAYDCYARDTRLLVDALGQNGVGDGR
jgi:DNA-binding MarR family transcriptional regulator